MRRLLATVLLGLAGTAAAGAAEFPFSPDTPYYFEHFDSRQQPWQPGHGLNIEEVFKNYQYYEIRFLKNGQDIQVTHYVQGRKEGVERYQIKSDGTLEKLPQ